MLPQGMSPVRTSPIIQVRYRLRDLIRADLWRPEPSGRPCTTTELCRNADLIDLIDQVGRAYSYPVNAVLPTAVANPLALIPRLFPGEPINGQ